MPGKFYVDRQCTDCDSCRTTAPATFGHDKATGTSCVVCQPKTPEEVAAAMEALRACGSDAIGCDGEEQAGAAAEPASREIPGPQQVMSHPMPQHVAPSALGVAARIFLIVCTIHFLTAAVSPIKMILFFPIGLKIAGLLNFSIAACGISGSILCQFWTIRSTRYLLLGALAAHTFIFLLNNVGLISHAFAHLRFWFLLHGGPGSYTFTIGVDAWVAALWALAVTLLPRPGDPLRA